jgi:hypothetical protein
MYQIGEIGSGLDGEPSSHHPERKQKRHGLAQISRIWLGGSQTPEDCSRQQRQKLIIRHPARTISNKSVQIRGIRGVFFSF